MGDCQQEKPVVRGGSWNDNGRNLRSAYRNHDDHHDFIDDNNGFRLARFLFVAGWRTRTRQHPTHGRILFCRAKDKAAGMLVATGERRPAAVFFHETETINV